MNETILINYIHDKLKILKDDYGYIFKKVIKGTVPPLDAITVFPSIAFYVAENTYTNNKSHQVVESEVLIYLYNRHTTSGLNVYDINTDLVMLIRQVINKFSDENHNIIESYVIKATHDGGSIFPRTIVELNTKIKYIESKSC